jgi:hypothetical protein
MEGLGAADDRDLWLMRRLFVVSQFEIPSSNRSSA